MNLFEWLSLGLAALPTFLGIALLIMQAITARRVGEVHILFNSRMTELMEAAKKLAHLEGRAERDAEEHK